MDDLHSGMAALAKAENSTPDRKRLTFLMQEFVKHVYFFTAANGAKAAGYNVDSDDDFLRQLTFCVLRLKDDSVVGGQYTAAEHEDRHEVQRKVMFAALSNLDASLEADWEDVETEESKKQDFEAKAKDLMNWLCEHGHPHMTIIITPTSAELLEGSMAFTTSEFVRD